MFSRILLIFLSSFAELFGTMNSNEIPYVPESMEPGYGNWRGVFHTKVGPIIHTPEYFQVGVDNIIKKDNQWSGFFVNTFGDFSLKAPLFLSVNLSPSFFMEQLIEAGLLLEGHLPVGKRKVIPKAILPSPPLTQLRRRIPRDSD
jgi:hypothetical protein